MSRAFTRESDGQELDELPELVVSPHRNLVTPTGLAQIEDQVRELRHAIAAARATEDRAQLARLERDLRYWTQRLASAELVPPAADTDVVRFGSRITLLADDQREHVFSIVGEDEAEPRSGLISYVSPLAESMIGCRVGDTVRLGAQRAEIVEIGRLAKGQT